MKYILFFLHILALVHGTQAESVLTGHLPKTADNSYHIYLKELPTGGTTAALLEEETIANSKGRFQFRLNLERAVFFNLIVVTTFPDGNKSNNNRTIFLKPGDKLKLNFVWDSPFSLKTDYSKVRDKNNKILLETQERVAKHDRMLFEQKFDPIRSKESLARFYTISDSLLNRHRLSPEVAKYIRFYSFDQYNATMYNQGMDLRKFSGADTKAYYSQPKNPIAYFNDGMLLSFYTGMMDIINYLDLAIDLKPYNRLKSLPQIELQYHHLDSLLDNRTIKDQVLERLLSSYASSYRAGNSYESDLTNYSTLADHIQDQKLRTHTVQLFENLRYTLSGSNWPSVPLHNSTGESIALDSFKGKYVLIDLWASWCVPCIKMMPHLQALEKTYADKDIVFIALSIDADRSKWLHKINELHLEGHQLLDQKGDFAKLLNVTGIPHYILYDREGKLIKYKTATPDSPQLKELLDSYL